MAATLGNGNITFGDSTVQSTAAVPLTGGTMTGMLELSGAAPQIKLTDNSGTNTGDFLVHVNDSNFYVLPDRESDGAFETPYALQLDAGNNVSYTWGNTILHSANYSSYALPLSGGTVSGSIFVNANAAYDLGSVTNAWRNIYTNDLHLSNMGHEEGNSVDGTKGNWTVQEGEDHLYIINNRNGKKYKFSLEEVK